MASMNTEINEQTGLVNVPTVLGMNSTGDIQGVLSTNGTMITIVLLGFVIAVYLVFFTSMDSHRPPVSGGDYMDIMTGSITTAPQQGSGDITVDSFFSTLVWGMLIFLVLINGIQYLFKFNISASIKDFLTQSPEVTVDVKRKIKKVIPRPIVKEDEVFHITDNEYTYEDAQAACKAFDARLASYDEVEAAYKNGGEWCSYGWTQNQMALFPTQKGTWEKLQKVKGHENDCGRPGINGGFIANPKVRFGATCFGKKPKMSPQEMARMADTSKYPVEEGKKVENEKVRAYKKKLDDMIIAPFNTDKWSSI